MSSSPQPEMGPGEHQKPTPSLCSTFLGVSSSLSRSPRIEGGADGNCQQLIMITDEELEVGGGGRKLEGAELLARHPGEPLEEGLQKALVGSPYPLLAVSPNPKRSSGETLGFLGSCVWR